MEAPITTALDNLTNGLAYMDHYVDAAAWAVGGKASIADCVLIPVLNAVALIGKFYDMPDLISKHPKLGIYWEIAKQEPIHAKVIAEQLAKAPTINPLAV